MADLSDLRRRIDARARSAIRESARNLQVALRANAPHRSFRLRGSIEVTPRDLTATSVVGVDYATFTTEGTRAHEIVPRNRGPIRTRRYLSWIGPRGRVFRLRVFHPGTKANPWYSRQVARWPEFLRRNFDRIRA